MYSGIAILLLWFLFSTKTVTDPDAEHTGYSLNKVILFFRFGLIFDNINRDYLKTKENKIGLVDMIKELYPNIEDVSTVLDIGISNYYN